MYGFLLSEDQGTARCVSVLSYPVDGWDPSHFFHSGWNTLLCFLSLVLLGLSSCKEHSPFWESSICWGSRAIFSFFGTLTFIFVVPYIHTVFTVCKCWINPFQSNFSANCILPSSYLFIPAIFLQAQPHEYNAQSPAHIKTHGLPRNRKSTTCDICWPKSVLHEEKRRTGSDIGAEQENHNVGRGPT
jgi:hypothetical protein